MSSISNPPSSSADVESPAHNESAPGLLAMIWRPLLIGLVLVPINVFWTTVIEVRWYGLDSTSLPLFILPVFLLFMLVLTNMAVRRLLPRARALSQAELLMVYVMMAVSCTFCGHDTLQNMFGSIPYAYWRANQINRFQQLFFAYLPTWLVVTDPDALAAWSRGGVRIYTPEGQAYLRAWIVPLTVWAGFFLTLFGMYLCMTVLVRKAWIENEKLSFPIVQLPMAMTADDAPTAFFGSRTMWAGFTLAFAVSLLNGIHTLYPSVPELHVTLFRLDQYFITPPWSAIGSTTSSFYPFAIGLAYFMPLDLSFSCWFFFVLARVFRILGSAYGWDAGPAAHGFPFFGEQATGAWVGLGIMLIYSARHYWIAVVRSIFLGRRASDPEEASRYRAAALGLLIGGVFMFVFGLLVGLSPWVVAAFFGIIFLLGFVITRVRAELGAPHEIVWVNPEQVLITVFGTAALGPQNLTALSALYWFNRGYRNHPMPNQLEAFKMLDRQKGVNIATVTILLVCAGLISLVATDWANLHVTYWFGSESKAIGYKSWVGAESYTRLAGWLNQPVPPAGIGLRYIFGGFLLTVLLSWLRLNLSWMPFHPAGYALATSYAMEYFWLPVFIAWLCKFTILRYGGLKMYKGAVPFFLGLILGDYTIGSIWALIGPILGIQTYRIYIF